MRIEIKDGKRIGAKALRPDETTADFKERIKAMMPKRVEDRPCIRKPTDAGYYPPARK